jgi:cytochrome c
MRARRASIFAALAVLLGVAAAVAGYVASAGRGPEHKARQLARAALIQNGCAACHQIPGVPSAAGLVGPPLAGLKRRLYIAGGLPNTQENLVRFITDPRGVDPKTAMPATGIDIETARAVAAYLTSR